MFRCVQCGKEFAGPANFCSHCGGKLETADAPAAPKVDASSTVRRGARRTWTWRAVWIGFLLLASVLELLARQDPSFRDTTEKFNSKLYVAASRLSLFGIGRNYYSYLWSMGEPGLECAERFSFDLPIYRPFDPRSLTTPSPRAFSGTTCECSNGSKKYSTPGLCPPKRPFGFYWWDASWYTAKAAFSAGWLSTIVGGIGVGLAALTLGMSHEPGKEGLPLKMMLFVPLIASGYVMLLQGFILLATILFGWLLVVSAVPFAVALVGIIKEIGTIVDRERERRAAAP
jgi:hypothetical protein